MAIIITVSCRCLTWLPVVVVHRSGPPQPSSSPTVIVVYCRRHGHCPLSLVIPRQYVNAQNQLLNLKNSISPQLM